MHAHDEHTTPLDWLLEPDPANPGVRYFALRDLLGCPADDPDVVAAQADVMRTGPVPATLAAQDPEGYWVKPGPGYGPKYRGTVWSLIFLGQLGADGRDPRVRRAIDYVLPGQDVVRCRTEGPPKQVGRAARDAGAAAARRRGGACEASVRRDLPNYLIPRASRRDMSQ